MVEGITDAHRCGLKLPGQETRSPSDFELFIEGILEAPRGPRDIFPNRTYVPAFKNDAAFGAESGECALPGPLCNGSLLHHHKGCDTGACNTGCTTNGTVPYVSGQLAPAQIQAPAALLPGTMAPATVVPTSAPEVTPLPPTQAPASEVKPVEKTEVPVVSVPVVPATPASETPPQVVPASETPRADRTASTTSSADPFERSKVVDRTNQPRQGKALREISTPCLFVKQNSNSVALVQACKPGQETWLIDSIQYLCDA